MNVVKAAQTIKFSAGSYARTWGFRTATGAKYVAPARARGMLLRRHVDEGGQLLMAAEDVEVVAHGPAATLRLGTAVSLRERVRLMFEKEGTGTIELGDGVFVNARSEIRCVESIAIGAGSKLSCDVLVMDFDGHPLDGAESSRPVVIGEHVWVGAKAIVLKGVTIGAGAVIGAGSIVTRDVPAGTLAVGSPARVIRERITWGD